MILPSPMEACTAILHPRPDQLLTPSSKSGFSMMLSSAVYTHVKTKTDSMRMLTPGFGPSK
ncbi:hypothetical protein HanXRQr2_Chr09g0385361 [Helianthus annuus]|uniref:Uncharacterized protein n=1 Tax=Helianthus annuus TaxID=4232 RepID=A0A9K3I550_HELAN|nr:hypothetical protein HanXRQr2_Chr09g0385361 [Helianthus annuus]KAJ0892890.1 hypothetical protein HanPSC8_Chr09g0371321 [Helianthus annuus]